jgi:hypothetical protein
VQSFHACGFRPLRAAECSNSPPAPLQAAARPAAIPLLLLQPQRRAPHLASVGGSPTWKGMERSGSGGQVLSMRGSPTVRSASPQLNLVVGCQSSPTRRTAVAAQQAGLSAAPSHTDRQTASVPVHRLAGWGGSHATPGACEGGQRAPAMRTGTPAAAYLSQEAAAAHCTLRGGQKLGGWPGDCPAGARGIPPGCCCCIIKWEGCMGMLPGGMGPRGGPAGPPMCPGCGGGRPCRETRPSTLV